MEGGQILMDLRWNTIKYVDCMDSEEGLPSLPDNSFEMAFTDPPYNVGYKGKGKRRDEVLYSDNREDYLRFCKGWFRELKRITRYQLIHCGFPNLNMWIADIEKPKGILYHYKEDVQTGSSIAHLDKMTPILVYGNPNYRFRINPIKTRNYKDKLRGSFKCNCPLNRNFLMKVLLRQRPESVIDPFMGSGTTAFCCKKLDITYFGYEINRELSSDYYKNINQKGILDEY